MAFETDFYDSIATKYEQAFAHNPGLLAFVAQALSHLAPKSSVLDLGCGTGRPVAELTLKAGHKVHCVDFSSAMLDLAKKAVPTATFEQADMFEYQPSETFDALFSVFSLWSPAPEKIKEVTDRWASWVKPGGYLFLGTIIAEEYPGVEPAMIDEDGLVGRNVKCTFMGDTSFHSLFTRLGWKKLVEDGGFGVLYTNLAMFQAPAEAECAIEPHWYIIARKKAVAI